MLSFLKNINLGFLNPLSASDGYVALDIGSSSIKMVETAIEKNGYRVLNMGILPLPEYAIQNNMVVDSKPVADPRPRGRCEVEAGDIRRSGAGRDHEKGSNAQAGTRRTGSEHRI